MATTIKSRFPLLLLLGIIFLGSVCVSYGIVGEQEERHPGQWKPPHEREEDERRPGEWRPPRGGRQEGQEQRPGQWRPSHEREEDEEDEHQKRRPGQWRPTRGGRQEGQEQRPGRFPSEREEYDEDDRRERRPGQQRPTREGRWKGQEQRPEQWRPSRGKEEREKEERQKHQPGREREKWEKREDEEWRGRQRHEDPDERARLRHREERRQKEEEHQKGDRPSRTPSRRERGEEEEGSSESEGRRNPFLFRSNRFQTLFENENGHIRLIQRFDKRSNLFQNLKNYRLLEYRAKPHTIFLPHHTDADFILVVLSGKAILTVLNSNNRNSFNLEQGDTIKLPAGSTAYLVNQDNDEDLRVVDLVIPVNRPGKFQSFDLSGNQNNPSYFRGFSKSILEASFNTDYETIERVLLEEHEHEQQQRRGRKGRQQSQEANAIVKVSREQIEELRRHAKSSSKRSISSESGPFNLRNRNPLYSNKFGKFFEITPEKNPQLQDLDIFVSSVEINEVITYINNKIRQL
ncbi:vicilin 47 kDa protein [Medicago truncatula]|uniref:Vicilin 47 kDa protein n=1 Tax=Medicago truncatula TaxID=3880 RepID=A0A072VR24_MEDTR|nr:vicilin 47 kDa protein [Medicago truncatula]